jgi:hypothetical protein
LASNPNATTPGWQLPMPSMMQVHGDGTRGGAYILRMQHLGRFLGILGLTLVATTIVSCNNSPTEPVVTVHDSIDSLFVEPASVILRAGEPVTFTVTLTYTLTSAPTGFVAIVVQDQSFRNLSTTVPQPKVDVVQGTGRVTLTDSVIIPATGVTQVDVSFPLFATGATSTQVAKKLSFLVR